jgi:CubicO group peptidase (beta-lactamase class C family)
MTELYVWQTASPEEARMSTARLDAWRETLAAHRTSDLLVVRGGKIVYEWHAPGRGPASQHGTASLAKALVGGMSLLVALADGLVDLDDPASKYIPEWRGHPLRGEITLRQLASHSSGLEDANAPRIDHFALGGWMEAFWRQEPDPFTISRDQVPFVYRPGTDYAYSNPGMAMLAYAVTAAIQGTAHRDIRTLLRERVMQPLGVGDEEWEVGYGRTFQVDGLPLVANWGGGSYTARAAAAVGLLMMHGGRWQGREVLAEDAVRRMLRMPGTPRPTPSPENPILVPGICWWLNADGCWPEIPRDAFMGYGAGHEVMLVVPSLDLVLVRFGEWLGANPEVSRWAELHRYLVEPLVDTLLPDLPADRAAAPYPPSPVIRGVHWDPPSTIIRRAYDSDNWPATWADDDRLYAAYGDGQGFEPFVGTKLGLGFTRIEGLPPRFEGFNIRSATGENLGMGAHGAKASGLLSVGGTLYMLCRNAGNSRLAWSSDHARTWEWADWRWTQSMGYPTFLQFGRDYAGARDGYVYVYSHDGDSAYAPADRFILARVPVERIREREAYEFFVRLAEDGAPEWSADIGDRGAVFEHPGRCARSSVSYDPGVGRYLWWQNIPLAGGAVDTRFRGGFGLYDAPEPWGPWTVAYYTLAWDVGPGEAGTIPTKWLGRDGRTGWLLFSGHDFCSVRRFSLEVAGE